MNRIIFMVWVLVAFTCAVVNVFSQPVESPPIPSGTRNYPNYGIGTLNRVKHYTVKQDVGAGNPVNVALPWWSKTVEIFNPTTDVSVRCFIGPTTAALANGDKATWRPVPPGASISYTSETTSVWLVIQDVTSPPTRTYFIQGIK